MRKLFNAVIAASWMFLFITGCSQADQKQPQKSPARHTVELTMMKFTPVTIDVNKGDTIVFINNDIVTHDVTEQKEKAWSSSPLAAGSSWSLVATTSADYYCSIHPVMKGRINVK